MLFVSSVHMVQFVTYNSFLLYYLNHRNDLQISDYDRSCVKVKYHVNGSLVALVTNMV